MFSGIFRYEEREGPEHHSELTVTYLTVTISVNNINHLLDLLIAHLELKEILTKLKSSAQLSAQSQSQSEHLSKS